MIETLTTIMNGETVHLHRCRECSKLGAMAIGKPLQDNGFIPVSRAIHHLPGCPDREWAPGSRGGLHLPGWAHSPLMVVDHMIARRADTELGSRPRVNPRSGQWRKRRKK